MNEQENIPVPVKRGPNGRFLSTPGCPGRPPGRGKRGELRQVWLRLASGRDLTTAWKTLRRLAKRGKDREKVQAARIMLDRLLGKAESVLLIENAQGDGPDIRLFSTAAEFAAIRDYRALLEARAACPACAPGVPCPSHLHSNLLGPEGPDATSASGPSAVLEPEKSMDCA